MITDTAYNDDYHWYLDRGFCHDEAAWQATQLAQQRANRARKADAWKTCAFTGAALIALVLGAASVAFVA